jgi:acetyltransferase-like isoleucine patch superfamily enzyme
MAYSCYGENHSTHPINYVSQSPYFYQKEWAKKDVKDISRAELMIGNDVWIGYGAIILPGCKRIGNGAVIGAGSVVTKDVEPYSIVGGNPAKVIKYRFSDEQQKMLEESEWWNFAPEELLEHYDHIDDITYFLSRLK